MSAETLRSACARLVAEGEATPVMGSAIRLNSSNSPEVQRRMAEIEIGYAKTFDELAAEDDRLAREAAKRLRDFVIVPQY